MQSRFDLRKELAVSVFLGGVSLLYVCWRWGVTWENLQFPFVYVGSDEFETVVDGMSLRGSVLPSVQSFMIFQGCSCIISMSSYSSHCCFSCRMYSRS